MIQSELISINGDKIINLSDISRVIPMQDSDNYIVIFKNGNGNLLLTEDEYDSLSKFLFPSIHI